jgi:hypothetical protein
MGESLLVGNASVLLNPRPGGTLCRDRSPSQSKGVSMCRGGNIRISGGQNNANLLT